MGDGHPLVPKQVTKWYVKDELAFVKKNGYIYVCTEKNLEGYNLNCYQRLSSEDRVQREIVPAFL